MRNAKRITPSWPCIHQIDYFTGIQMIKHELSYNDTLHVFSRMGHNHERFDKNIYTDMLEPENVFGDNRSSRHQHHPFQIKIYDTHSRLFTGNFYRCVIPY